MTLARADLALIVSGASQQYLCNAATTVRKPGEFLLSNLRMPLIDTLTAFGHEIALPRAVITSFCAKWPEAETVPAEAAVCKAGYSHHLDCNIWRVD